MPTSSVAVVICWLDGAFKLGILGYLSQEAQKMPVAQFWVWKNMWFSK